MTSTTDRIPPNGPRLSSDEPSTVCRRPFAIEVGDPDLVFKEFVITDPVPTGRQILATAKALPVNDHLVFRMLEDGQLEDLRLDETTDIEGDKTARFLVFRSAESFRFELDQRRFEWGTSGISGIVLKKLAGVDLKTYGVWQEVPGSEDHAIKDEDVVDLKKRGLERFFTGILETTEGGQR